MAFPRYKNGIVKDVLIPRVAEQMKTSPKIVEAVVMHQCKNIIKKIGTTGITSVEMSGFGKWTFLPAKAKRIAGLLEEDIQKKLQGLPIKRRNNTVEDLQKEIDYIKNQLAYVEQNKSNSRRLGKRNSEKDRRGGSGQSTPADLRDMPEQFQEQQ